MGEPPSFALQRQEADALLSLLRAQRPAPPADKHMKPVEFEGQTRLLGPPPGTKRGQCGALPVIIFSEGGYIYSYASFWKPSSEDLQRLNSGEYIRLDVFGGAHPPVWVGVDRIVERP